MNEDYLSIGEAAKLMEVCINTLRDWDEEGKFVASRTDGGHRRYTLDQVRKYLEENPIEEKENSKNSDYVPTEMEKIIDKWELKGWLHNINNSKDKKIIAILLENADSTFNNSAIISNKIFKKEEILWLTKKGWQLSKLKNIIPVCPITGPVALAYYKETTSKSFSIKSEPIAAKTCKYEFTIFPKANFESIKEVYADAIATSIDNIIFDSLSETNKCSIEDILDLSIISNEDLKDSFDYIVGPHEMINLLKQNKCAQNIDLYSINAKVCPKDFSPMAISGRYPKSNLDNPAFYPYVLFMEGPTTVNGFACALTRYAIFKN